MLIFRVVMLILFVRWEGWTRQGRARTLAVQTDTLLPVPQAGTAARRAFCALPLAHVRTFAYRRKPVFPILLASLHAIFKSRPTR